MAKGEGDIADSFDLTLYGQGRGGDKADSFEPTLCSQGGGGLSR